MGQKFKTMVVQCPLQEREVEVVYTMIGSWLSSEFKILFCPAKTDSCGNCHRQCKSILAHSPNPEEWYSHRLLSPRGVHSIVH